jgi:uncharacterized protein (TIGR00369 family)
MEPTEIFETSPFLNHLNISLLEANDGYVEAELEATDELLSVAGGQALQGDVVASFADGIAGLAVGDAVQGITPTNDIRVDYLRPPTTDLRAKAEVTCIAASVGRADVDVSGTDGALVATARAIYKVGEEPYETPWTAID